MEEGGVQAIDRLVEKLIESREAIESLLNLINALQKTGILPLLVGIINNFDQNLTFLAEQNAMLIRNINVIYAVLSGKEETKDISLSELIKELSDPDVKRGLHLLLKVLRAIGSASKES